jgi:hypothetical protein
MGRVISLLGDGNRVPFTGDESMCSPEHR